MSDPMSDPSGTEHGPGAGQDQAAERRVVTVGSSVGLHARPASLFSQAAEDTGVPVALTTTSGRTVNAASILGLLLLNISYGDTVTLSASGDGAAAALDGLAALLASDLDQH